MKVARIQVELVSTDHDSADTPSRKAFRYDGTAWHVEDVNGAAAPIWPRDLSLMQALDTARKAYGG